MLVKPCLPDVLLTEIRILLKRSAELRAHSQQLHRRVTDEIERSRRLHELMGRTRKAMSHVLDRRQTGEPPLLPPAPLCPVCNQPLAYQHSQIGGVSARYPEQWDYFSCPAACGAFQYRHRTRALRKVPA